VVVDDGLATGATMRVAVLALRGRGAARVIVATPVGSEEACGLLELNADAVVCPLVPERFKAVGAWYEQFRPVPDEDVGEILRRAWTRLAI
jgi:predicted phosphoribosyltransferase